MDETIYDSRPDTYQHIQTVQANLQKVIVDLMQRAAEHDQSKLQEPELSTFNEYTPKLKASTYGSDEYKGFLKGMKKGLDHHYENNRHHPEYWGFDDTSYNPETVRNGDAIKSMNLLDIIEMLCDWMAATERHADGDILKSIEINQQRFGYSDEMKAILLNTVKMLEKQ